MFCSSNKSLDQDLSGNINFMKISWEMTEILRLKVCHSALKFSNQREQCPTVLILSALCLAGQALNANVDTCSLWDQSKQKVRGL